MLIYFTSEYETHFCQVAVCSMLIHILHDLLDVARILIRFNLDIYLCTQYAVSRKREITFVSFRFVFFVFCFILLCGLNF